MLPLGMETADDLIDEVVTGLSRMAEFVETQRIFLDLKSKTLNYEDIWNMKVELLNFHKEEINKEIKRQAKNHAIQHVAWPFAR